MSVARALSVAADQAERLADNAERVVGVYRELRQEVQSVDDIAPGPGRTSSGGPPTTSRTLGGEGGGSGNGLGGGVGGGRLSSGGGGGSGSGIGTGLPDGLRFGAEPVPRRLGPGDPTVFLANQVLQRLNQIDGALRGLGAHGLNNRARDRAGIR